jgi:hypothetical protein
MVTTLAASIDQLYDVFESYPRPRTLSACACCWTGDRVDAGDAIGRVQVQVWAPGEGRPLIFSRLPNTSR